MLWVWKKERKDGRKEREKRKNEGEKEREIKKLCVNMSVLTELNICVKERVVSKQMNI